jgi:hypothetical protein
MSEGGVACDPPHLTKPRMALSSLCGTVCRPHLPCRHEAAEPVPAKPVACRGRASFLPRVAASRSLRQAANPPVRAEAVAGQRPPRLPEHVFGKRVPRLRARKWWCVSTASGALCRRKTSPRVLSGGRRPPAKRRPARAAVSGCGVVPSEAADPARAA